MFPLVGNDFPTTAPALAAAIEAALAQIFTVPGGAGTVAVTGNDFPALEAVTVRLDGATVASLELPPTPRPVEGQREGGVTVGRFDLSARPIHYQRAKLDLQVSATGVTFAFARDERQHPILVLTDADDGHVEGTIGRADVQALLWAAATAAAAGQKIAIQDLHVDLSSDGPRSVAATIRIKAKKMMLSGVVVVTGRVDVDDDLVATVSGLSCRGEGMIGIAAAGLLQNQVRPFDGSRVSLMAISLGSVKLRDLRVTINDAVRVTAAFGNGR